jgi:hypothetical protein
LHRNRRGLAVVIQAPRGFDAIPQLRIARRHFAHRIARAKAFGQHPKRAVSHARHWGDENGVRERVAADVHGLQQQIFSGKSEFLG